MKKEHLPAILFFGGLWGLSEAFLGGAMYRNNVPFASVPLTIIGLSILTFAYVYFPQTGMATLIAAFAMLYKFLNMPFFACHILAIVLLGVSYDLFFNVFRIKNRSISAAASVYLGFALFAVMITYVFRYSHWLEGGLAKVIQHIGISGSFAALGCAVFVPLSFFLAQRLKVKSAEPFALRMHPAPGGISVITAGLWIFSITVFLINM